MKSLWPIVIAIVLMQFDSAYSASATPKSKNAKKSELSTKIDFDGHQVGGARHLPFGSETAVEGQKSDRDLISVRQNFTDRQSLLETMRFE